MSKCKECHFLHVCSDGRRQRHDGICDDFYGNEPGMFYPGGSPPLKFCDICKHIDEKCLSMDEVDNYVMNHRITKDEAVEEFFVKRGYVLTDYRFLEGQCMSSCNRFEEKE